MGEWQLAGKAALLVVHMQNAVIKSPSPLEVLGHGRAAYEDGVVANCEDLVSAFRRKGLPVAFCVAYTDSDTKFPVYGGFWPGVRDSKANYKGTWDVEIIEELTPKADERIFHNWPFNVFQNTGLDEYLKEEGVNTVVLVGVATGMSVGTAAWAIAERFYNLIVVSDATTDANRELHRALLEWTLPAIGLVTSTEDVIAHL